LNSLDLTLSAINGVPEKIPFNPYIMHMAATLQNISYNHEFCRKPEVLNAWGVEIDWNSHTPVARTYLEIDEFESIETPDILENVRIQNRVKAVEILAEKVGGTQCIVGWIEAPFNYSV